MDTKGDIFVPVRRHALKVKACCKCHSPNRQVFDIVTPLTEHIRDYLPISALFSTMGHGRARDYHIASDITDHHGNLE